MPFRIISSPDPKYLAATDILVSDMSNINYDFLIYNRPIVLLANEWLIKNFPDIGIKTDLDHLEEAIARVINYPDEYKQQREYWHKKTMHNPDGNSSLRVFDAITKYSKFIKPVIIFIHGGNEISKFHLEPLFKISQSRGYRSILANNPKKIQISEDQRKNGVIFVATHNNVLKEIKNGFKVHIDHSVKGVGVTDYERLSLQYRENRYYPNTDLHITEGEVSYENTISLMGEYKNKVIMVGYPKSDLLIKANTFENKKDIFKSLGFDIAKPLITYAPTGKYRYPYKQGASLSNESIEKFKMVSKKNNYNILVKLRSKDNIIKKILDKLVRS